MKIELKNQKLEADIDIAKQYPLVWHCDENGAKVEDLSISPVQIHLEFAGDISLETGSLKLTDCMSLVKVIQELDKKYRQNICKEVKEGA
jgi:hypothetical protein